MRAAAAVAAGMGALALGGDGGGSIRIPSAFCGVAGFKPGYGVVPRAPGFKTWESIVAYGHTPVREAIWLTHRICRDTGCVFGGKLTALRWPERDLVEVPAERCWYPLSREEPEG